MPGAGFGQPVQFVLQENDLKLLAEVADNLANQARELPQLFNVNTNFEFSKPELEVRLTLSYLKEGDSRFYGRI
ncbi:MAG: hypothetical protein BRC40_02415 [Cyanobacteria bacterium QH_8_48_120]|nr:MAG: hypothetical protein BRC34_09320 [Cyanobacteria bacterium QH_1_48_107]PSO57680.1 MAG: hypothetical protein BRC39_14435 [Cyanobacteria bacterium QH_7_48_89]PSO61219.1 MAG: hypothetical protein BRC35_00495 [Cyanobacteria bacterium QH_10_48_56]PSO62686.1 MAG: hypothetical protein BRC38_15200 [Cyanobacteria bacterium QH_6_48_35]PSO77007.1 MAG: hypothetical protein BRC40_02415 [Cyanobacteria bacterium QH_8_48_120]